jgi:hypothetical protein
MTRRLAVDFCRRLFVRTVTRDLLASEENMYAVEFPMALDVVDLVWSAMQDDEFYIPNDLANSLKQPVQSVTRILEFLKKYKFAEQVTRREMIFRKVSDNPSPGDALKVLQTVLGDVRLDRTERANIPEAYKRFSASP